MTISRPTSATAAPSRLQRRERMPSPRPSQSNGTLPGSRRSACPTALRRCFPDERRAAERNAPLVLPLLSSADRGFELFVVCSEQLSLAIAITPWPIPFARVSDLRPGLHTSRAGQQPVSAAQRVAAHGAHRARLPGVVPVRRRAAVLRRSRRRTVREPAGRAAPARCLSVAGEARLRLHAGAGLHAVAPPGWPRTAASHGICRCT